MTGDPGSAVRREPTSGNHAMQVRVEGKILRPGVQDAGESDLGAEMFWISGDLFEGARDSGEEDAVHEPLIAVDEWPQLTRHRKHDMEVGHRQQTLDALGDPFRTLRPLTLGTVAIPAGVVGDLFVSTTAATVDMAAQGRSPATGDATDHLVLGRRQITATAKFTAVAADQIGDLELRPL